MDDTNPYRPPQANLGIRRPVGRYRPVITVVRVLVALWALFVLAGPPRFAPVADSRREEVATKALGALLFLLAVFPFRKPQVSQPNVIPGEAEDL